MSRLICSALGFDGGKSGISVYMRATFSALAQHHELTIFALKKEIPLLPSSPHITYRPVSNLMAKPILNMMWHLFVLPFLISRKKQDAIFLPAANRRALAFYPLPSVAVVHDLSQYHVKCKYDRFRMFYIQKVLPYYVRKAQRIIAISESTKSDLIRYWKVPEGKIEVDYNGYDATVFNPVVPHAKIKQIREKYAIRKPFILYISRIEHPGKNHLRLIQAYEQLPPALQEAYDLVLPGGRWNGAEVVEDYMRTSPVRDHIHFTGFIESDELPAFYHASTMYVFPSLFEGFGLSLLESMACGTPIACANTSSLGEIGGEASLQFNPEDVGEIQRAMERLLSDDNARTALIEKGFERIKLFSWDLHAQQLFPEG